MRAALIALMLMFGSQAGAEISGSMSCKVKSNSVTALEEGKTISILVSKVNLKKVILLYLHTCSVQDSPLVCLLQRKSAPTLNQA